MPVCQFGHFYVDPAEIIAVDTKPEEREEDDYYHVYVKGIRDFIILEGEAARSCFIAFMDISGNRK